MESVLPILQDLRTDLTPAWLSLAIGCEVLSFQWKFLKKSPGCVVLCYSIESNGKVATSMVLKCHDMDEKIRALQVSSLMYDREVYFYRSLAAGLKDLNAPRVYAIGQQTQEFYYILMENLLEEWQPCRFNPDGAISKETMRLVILDIMKMHVTFWNHELMNSSPFFEKEVLHDQLQRILEFKESWKTVRTRFPAMSGWRERESNGYPKNMQKLVQYLDFCALDDNALIYYKKANAILGERPFTLVHGDLNCSNFFFGGRPDNSNTICWIDWGMTRSGPVALDFLTLWSTLSITNEGMTHDFHFAFSKLDVSIPLLREYYELLCLQLPEIETSYPFDLILNDICLFFGANIMAVITMLATNNLSRGAWMFWGKAFERMIYHLWNPFNAQMILFTALNITEDCALIK